MIEQHAALVFAAHFVSQPATDWHETHKRSKNKTVRRMAIAAKARSVILLDRVLRGDLRSIGIDSDYLAGDSLDEVVDKPMQRDCGGAQHAKGENP